jgi:malonyl CoA-acyl carrier protein transacylase
MSHAAGPLFIFPGQGSQYRGMGSDLIADYAVARTIYQRASEAAGYDMVELSTRDPEGKLEQTRYTQPALLTHAVACLEVFRELTDGAVEPVLAAGHSLGEYTALVASGALGFEDAVRLVSVRGDLMERHGTGKMLAISLDRETVSSFADRFFCEIGGCNLPEQTVVGGREPDLAALGEHVKQVFGKSPVPLKTAGAFHTYLMITAAEELRAPLQAVTFAPMRCPVLSNYSGDYHDPEGRAVASRLFFQIFSPVKWIWGMQRALKDEYRVVNAVVEFGGGVGAGESPASKRPNLEGITRKTLRALGHSAVYLPAIAKASIERSARVFRAAGRLRDTPHDDPPCPAHFGVHGNAVDETWYHLFVPTQHGFPVEAAVEVLSGVEGSAMSGVVQSCAQTIDENRGDVASFFAESPAAPEAYLEVVVGCETACVLYYRGAELEVVLAALTERLRREGALRGRAAALV